MTSISNTNAITITGDTGINNVELSALSTSNKATIDLVSDNAADLLIFNLADSSSYVEFNNDGSIKSGSASTFSFNKINNFDPTGGEDKFGVFYGGNTTKGIFTDISSTSTTFSMKLNDGIVYEDNFNSYDGLYLTNTNATDALTVKNNIGGLINAGGSGPNNRGSSSLDFTYILYAQSSDNSSETSAYVYAGTYGSANSASNNFDPSQLKIVGLAEIKITDASIVDEMLLTLRVH